MPLVVVIAPLLKLFTLKTVVLLALRSKPLPPPLASKFMDHQNVNVSPTCIAESKALPPLKYAPPVA